jgi:hypothetical protein
MNEIKVGRRQTRSGRPVGRPRRITLVKVQTASMLREQGLPWKDIAKRVGLPAESCRKAVRDHRAGGRQ